MSCFSPSPAPCPGTASCSVIWKNFFCVQPYPWPRPGLMMALADLAAAFAVAPNLLSRHLDQWLTADLWDDRRLAQDFRAAMLWLCLSRLEPDGEDRAQPA